MAKEIKHPTMEELIRNDSVYSSMRWAFLMMVKIGLIISILSVIAVLVGAFYNKQVNLTAIIALLGVLFTTAFGGKSAQSFAENRNPVDLLKSLVPGKETVPEKPEIK
jgi:hypothetical protein